jgi:hypothetical protein
MPFVPDLDKPEDPPSAKRVKTEASEEEPSEDYTKMATPFSPVASNKKTKSSKELAKAAKGTKSVASFFTVKAKK